MRCFDFFPSSVQHTHPPLARSFLHPHKFSCSAKLRSTGSWHVHVSSDTSRDEIHTCTYIIDIVTSLSNHNGSCCVAKITEKRRSDNNVRVHEKSGGLFIGQKIELENVPTIANNARQCREQLNSQQLLCNSLSAILHCAHLFASLQISSVCSQVKHLHFSP